MAVWASVAGDPRASQRAMLAGTANSWESKRLRLNTYGEECSRKMPAINLRPLHACMDIDMYTHGYRHVCPVHVSARGTMCVKKVTGDVIKEGTCLKHTAP